MLVDRLLQIIEAAVFIQIGVGRVCFHQGGQLLLVDAANFDQGIDTFNSSLRLIVGRLIAIRAGWVNLDIAALGVVQEDFRDGLLV
ncbi:hypothetical protein RE6C_05004 [Rhodopirellula europaea 6C]|uniref:Uncharacterized protein n=1 Tax=Rhodopirellula europaea 6C TaxID=1263867 RepID=M2APD6_9BACT|nr:hypothetical protein RE6C_05004 [Rhodopirellula europaea 6C]